MNDAASNTTVRFATVELSTRSAKSIDATPFGPNQAMNSLFGIGTLMGRNAKSTATGRATRSTNATRATSRAVEPSHPVVAMRAPKTANVITWKSALSVSLNSRYSPGSVWRTIANAMPPTNTAMSPFAHPLTSAMPKARNASASA